MQRVWVVGNSGSGKSRVGRCLAEALGCTYVELDAIFHQPGWVSLPTEEFRHRVASVVSAGTWVLDGNYSAVADLVRRRADTVVFLDLPRWLVMAQVVSRTLRRVISREELWNGNREPWSNLWRLDPAESIIAWAWTQHAKYRHRYRQMMADPASAHLAVHHVTSRKAADRLVAGARRPEAGVPDAPAPWQDLAP